MLTDKSLHTDREINSWDRKDSVPDSMESTVQRIEDLMEVLSELPCEWVSTSRVYEKLEKKPGKATSKRTIRRWISKLEDKGYLKTRGRTKDSEIYPLVEGRSKKELRP
jgi:repressor of nif and glnA expression